MGHLARILEAGGIATVVIAAQPFRSRMAAMTLPRLVVTPHPMGRVLGAPGDRQGQRKVVLAALDLLENASQGGTIYEVEGAYHPPATG